MSKTTKTTCPRCGVEFDDSDEGVLAFCSHTCEVPNVTVVAGVNAEREYTLIRYAVPRPDGSPQYAEWGDWPRDQRQHLASVIMGTDDPGELVASIIANPPEDLAILRQCGVFIRSDDHAVSLKTFMSALFDTILEAFQP